jgi:hypothetical protein
MKDHWASERSVTGMLFSCSVIYRATLSRPLFAQILYAVLRRSDVRCSEKISVVVYLSQNAPPLFSAAKPMFVGQLLHQPHMLSQREVSSPTQLSASGQVLLGYQLHSGCLDGMIHGFLTSLGRGYAKPCRLRAAFSSGRKRTKIAKLQTYHTPNWPWTHLAKIRGSLIPPSAWKVSTLTNHAQFTQERRDAQIAG